LIARSGISHGAISFIGYAQHT